MANSVDPDETPQNAASHLGLHCLPLILLRPVCPNTYGKYGTIYMFSTVSLNETLYSYMFHFSMKNNVRHSSEGHKTERKSIACKSQPVMFCVY